MKKKDLKIGLVIGKFAQLHYGHLDLLEYAIKIVDKVFVIIYDCPDKTAVPLDERAGWIRSFFPNENVIVIEGWNAPNQHEDTQLVRHLQEEYLGSVMSGINLTHIISSEDYGEHLSKYLNVKNIVYDKERHNRYISSTMIRDNFEINKEQIPEQIRERVQQDLINFKK